MPHLLSVAGSSASLSPESSSPLNESVSSPTSPHSPCEAAFSHLSSQPGVAVSHASEASVPLPEQVSYLGVERASLHQRALVSQLRQADEDEDLGYESGSEGGPSSRYTIRLQSESRLRRSIQPRRPRGFTAPVPSCRAPSNSMLAATISRPKRPLPVQLTIASCTRSPPRFSAEYPPWTPRSGGILCPSARHVPVSRSSPRNPFASATRPSSCTAGRRATISSVIESPSSVEARLSNRPQDRTSRAALLRQYPPVSPSLKAWIKNTDFTPLLAGHIEQASHMDMLTPRQPPGFCGPTWACTPDPRHTDPTAAQQWNHRATKAPVGLGIGLPSNHPLRTPLASTMSRLEASARSEPARRPASPSQAPGHGHAENKLRLRPTVLLDSPSPIMPLPPRAAGPDPGPGTPRNSPRVLRRTTTRAPVGLGLSLPSWSPRDASLSRLVSVYFSQRLSEASTCSPRVEDTQRPCLRPTPRTESPSPIVPLPRRMSQYASAGSVQVIAGPAI